MKKKVFAIVTLLMLVVSIFASVPVMADEAATEEIGGLDFYSITVHYENPVLTSYFTKTVAGKDYNYFQNINAKSEEDKYQYARGKKVISMTSENLVITAGSFQSLTTDDGAASKINTGLWFAKVPYSKAFLTHIVNGSAISSIEDFDLFGITKPYDDGAPYENKNPNVQYSDDGYALAVEKDANGNNLKIDINNYLIDTNDYIWKTSDGKRVELYMQVPIIKKTGLEVDGKAETRIELSDEYEWVPFDDRFDENGKIVNIKSLEYMYTVNQETYDAFLAAESQLSLKMTRTDNAEEFEKTPEERKKISYVSTYLVDNTKDNATYMNTSRQFTQADIVVNKDGFVAYTTPRIGTPLLNVKIKDITVEIDALGTQLYDDLATDPQQKNIITVSINDCEYNAKLYKQWFDEGLYTQEEFDKLEKFVLGTAKGKTTRTEILYETKDYKNKAEYGYSPTVASISIGASADLLAKLPVSATIFIDFDIYTQQPEAAWDETYKETMLSKANKTKGSTVPVDNIEILTDADKPVKPAQPVVQSSSFPTWAIIAIVAGGVVLLAAIVVVIVIVLKKKKNAK